MDQENLNILVNELNENINLLLTERTTSVQEKKDGYITSRSSINYISIYPVLLEALPSIEEDFFRSLLPDEEWKDIFVVMTQEQQYELHSSTN
ncbi:hypothetical protein AYI68_g7633 [Smittium mucronatum]|uniref:Uncharacterized protein n=1 Tax=Smittium mucronatum TaxID=133383 RepID=A0A1R0GN47_9FUNG|nr:hypothetical protein AYI68_g7633 [Smittium mucronatum]